MLSEAERQFREADPARDTIMENEILDALRRNEDGDASLFIAQNRGKLLFDHRADEWYVWLGHHWALDLTEEALSRVAGIADIYQEEMRRQAWARAGAERAGDKEKAKKTRGLQDALARRIRELQGLMRKRNVLHLARGGHGLGISGDEWDSDPWAFGVRNGVIDLRTGAHRAGIPADYIKTVAPMEWKGTDALCTQWERFLQGVFAGDQPLVDFMQRLLGSALCGEPLDAVLPILWGRGRNGKTVLLQAVAGVLGDLAGPVESELLLEGRFTKPSGGPSSDLFHLRGKRLVWLSETNENRGLNAGRIKLLSGGDLITGRVPYEKYQTTFRPTHTMFLCTNHKPRADASDFALWSRVLLIPFTQVFIDNPSHKGERPADKTLPGKLHAEGPGILAWLVRGCLEWRRAGLKPPESVRAATEEYRRDEDRIRAFLDECCVEGAGCILQASEAYRAYRGWAEKNGERPLSHIKFGQDMNQLFDSIKDRGGKRYLHVALRVGL